MDSDRDDGGCDQSPAVLLVGGREKPVWLPQMWFGFIVLWTTRRSTWSQPKSGWLSFKIGWPPMVWLVGQRCWWRQRTGEREGGNNSGSCLAGSACQSGNCLAGSAGQFVGSASQRSNSMASHTKYFKSVLDWIDSLYGPFSSLPTLVQFSQCRTLRCNTGQTEVK